VRTIASFLYKYFKFLTPRSLYTCIYYLPLIFRSSATGSEVLSEKTDHIMEFRECKKNLAVNKYFRNPYIANAKLYCLVGFTTSTVRIPRNVIK